MAHRSILTPLTNQLVPLWLRSLPLQSSLSSSLLSLPSAPSSASSATTAVHGLDSASSVRIYDCTAARVGSSSSFGGATNPGYWAASRSPPTGSPGGPTWCGSASPCGCGAAGRYWRTRLWVASAASSDIIPAGHAAPAPPRGYFWPEPHFHGSRDWCGAPMYRSPERTESLPARSPKGDTDHAGAGVGCILHSLLY